MEKFITLRQFRMGDKMAWDKKKLNAINKWLEMHIYDVFGVIF